MPKVNKRQSYLSKNDMATLAKDLAALAKGNHSRDQEIKQQLLKLYPNQGDKYQFRRKMEGRKRTDEFARARLPDIKTNADEIFVNSKTLRKDFNANKQSDKKVLNLPSQPFRLPAHDLLSESAIEQADIAKLKTDKTIRRNKEIPDVLYDPEVRKKNYIKKGLADSILTCDDVLYLPGEVVYSSDGLAYGPHGEVLGKYTTSFGKDGDIYAPDGISMHKKKVRANRLRKDSGDKISSIEKEVGEKEEIRETDDSSIASDMELASMVRVKTKNKNKSEEDLNMMYDGDTELVHEETILNPNRRRRFVKKQLTAGEMIELHMTTDTDDGGDTTAKNSDGEESDFSCPKSRSSSSPLGVSTGVIQSFIERYRLMRNKEINQAKSKFMEGDTSSCSYFASAQPFVTERGMVHIFHPVLGIIGINHKRVIIDGPDDWKARKFHHESFYDPEIYTVDTESIISVNYKILKIPPMYTTELIPPSSTTMEILLRKSHAKKIQALKCA